MAFSNLSPGSAAAPTAIQGNDLQEIQTDHLGFTGLHPGTETQIRLIPEPWPQDALPPPSSSLLSVASSTGIIAAAGPNHLVIATTTSVRKALMAADAKKIEVIRPFEPYMTIPKSGLAQVVFSANDTVLVISSQSQGGLEAFNVSALLEGNTRPAVQIPTGGTPLRALVPNPGDGRYHLFALLTTQGDLFIADLEAGTLTSDQHASPLRSSVSCLSWSNKGKQLVAGMANATAIQMKPDGSLVAEIPRPPLPDTYHASAISWLEDDSFFIIYTSDEPTEEVRTSEYFIVNRRPKSQDFTFHRLPEIIPPFGMERNPASHFISRLRNFPPHIHDLLILSATTGTDISLITKSDKSLSSTEDATGEFTFTSIENDGRRAVLPLSKADNNLDTSPIGMALDLSGDELVPRPIPSLPEIECSSGPCPNLLVLNNEGILLSWYLIYDDSIKEKTVFSGFEKLGSAPRPSPQPISASSPPSQPISASSGAFGQSGSLSAKPFASAASTFSAPDSQPSFTSTSASVFGQSSTIGNTKSSWASTGFDNSATSQTGGAGFGQPGFGQPGFGQTAAAPARAFGKPSIGAGSSSFGNNSSHASPFGASSQQSAGFASFSKKGGFGAAAQDGAASASFLNPSSASSFGKAGLGTSFGQTAPGTSFGGFGGSKSNTASGVFGNGGGFKLESSFQGDGTARDDLPKPSKSSGMFGIAVDDDMFGDSKNVTSPTHDKEEEMEEGEVVDDIDSENGEKHTFTGFGTQQPPKQLSQPLVTPPSTLAQPKATPAPPVSSLFGPLNTQSITPAAAVSTAFSFGQKPATTPNDKPAPLSSTTPKDTPFPPQKTMFGKNPTFSNTPALVEKSQPKFIFESNSKFAPEPPNAESKAPQIKQEPPSDDEAIDLNHIPPAPLPPDITSKPRYVSGDTSGSSNNSKISADTVDDAPLPPDFIKANKSAAAAEEEEEPALPSEDDSALSDGFEGSGEEVNETSSPIEEPTEDGIELPSDGHADNLQTSPESSFRSGEPSAETSPTGGLFTKVSANASQKPMRQLFGEVGSTGPILPPPKPHESPRSPSPVRKFPPATEALRNESARSVSAPAHGRASPSIIDKRRAEAAAASAQSQQKVAEEMAKRKAQQAVLAQQKALETARELEDLQDDEDERLRRELEAPISPSENLPQFVTYQSKSMEDGSKSGVPAQIERLYQDINCMIDTLGINSRALTAYMRYQQGQGPNESWPAVLNSDTPMDALNDEWVLGDISRLREGQNVIEARLGENQIDDVTGILHQCQSLLGQEIVELKTKLSSIRKTLHAKQSSEAAQASSLSAEQASIQQDLRKASASTHSKLGQVEDSLGILRAKLADVGALESESKRSGMLGRSGSQKKPTFEAVLSTITHMTSMAERKSADVDLLEAQLRKINLLNNKSSRNGTDSINGTPGKGQTSITPRTPSSGRSTVYHTPESKFGGSVRSTPGRNGVNGSGIIIAVEDRELWQTKARRKREAAAVLRAVLAERRKQGSANA